ncbi:MAG: GAP family protein [Candidatus Nanopelagicales bacterium]
MSSVVLGTLPFALGAAVSPAVLTVVVLILASGSHALKRAWLFALGGTILTALFIAICRTLLAQVGGSGDGPHTIDRVIDAALAVVLGVWAILIVLRKPKAPAKPSRIQALLSSRRSVVFVGLGAVAMALNASTLLIVLAGSHHITQANAPLDSKILASALLLLGAVLPLVLPPALVTMSGARAAGFLHRLNIFTTKHQRVINAAILAAIAVLLAWKAIQGS